ncbi:lactonase family protein [Paucilactobacillus nenjiangensis]|jgi:6-phosphogluconolactonase|uniref:Lactonase family protein n=1 Tax=Paucilactobacillus nenjiangensis TaxID=1296540 RepID=A0A5P1X1I5_9LACO|nr:lactonase family protein [Paucilactobacillus nenjiangensis]QER67772.1 lactonase family protein [Paucilactobacillus nenjiangensis]
MKETFIIGTYTKKTSKGIYTVELDTNSKTLSEPKFIIEASNPTYLAISKSHHLFSVIKEDDEGGVGSFDLNDNSFAAADKVLADGAPPAYVGIDEARQLVFSGNYHLATVDVMKTNNDGSLTLTDSVTHQGVTGPAPEQNTPHVHYCDLTPDQRLVVCDLGMDLVVVYDVSDDGKLTAVSQYHSEPGFGSRHIVFHHNGKFAYLMGELSSQVEVLSYNSTSAEFTHVQTIKTIPSDWTAHNGAAAIHISSDGRFLYNSNRGQNTIAVFEIGSDFKLTHLQSISTEGDFPRDFELDQTEDFLIVANQNTDNLTLYSRDKDTGLLTLNQKDVHCPEGVCVKVVH